MIQTSRRGFITGLASLLAAPAIVHAGNLMPVKVVRDLWTVTFDGGYVYFVAPSLYRALLLEGERGVIEQRLIPMAGESRGVTFHGAP